LLITKTKYLYKWLICHCISDAIPRLRSQRLLSALSTHSHTSLRHTSLPLKPSQSPQNTCIRAASISPHDLRHAIVLTLRCCGKHCGHWVWHDNEPLTHCFTKL
jgi:hypothetical protein